jgi:hypothetical protein
MVMTGRPSDEPLPSYPINAYHGQDNTNCIRSISRAEILPPKSVRKMAREGRNEGMEVEGHRDEDCRCAKLSLLDFV